MLDCRQFYEVLQAQGVSFTTGVPDSLLKNFCACIADTGSDIIAANEGAAIGLASGHYLATGKIPFVYMQNSGFGNTINPITSLIDPEVYAIPMLIMVGWRGEPGVKDEPQHIKQGRVNEALLQVLEIPYCILSPDMEQAEHQVSEAFTYMREKNAPYVLLVRKNTFDKYSLASKPAAFDLKREEALEIILGHLTEKDIIVSTTGKTSREVFEIREKNGQPHNRDFLTVGCMGHSSQIALGIALEKPDRNVLCLDGDGAVIMHMGSMAIAGDRAPGNYRHIIINNGSHESVGGQPTVGFNLDFRKIAEGCGYRKVLQASDREEIDQQMSTFLATEGPVLFEIKTAIGSRDDLGRPTIKPVDNKKDFMQNLQ
ncbi:MAG: phosphonopyruvate decarboxylase [Cyclobacteriaceae bacterium]|nr:phosphonopyruvate decarboxylase [Cyclobacteriaceae bacterium HetDA_MAG_MS6]